MLESYCLFSSSRKPWMILKKFLKYFFILKIIFLYGCMRDIKSKKKILLLEVGELQGLRELQKLYTYTSSTLLGAA